MAESETLNERKKRISEGFASIFSSQQEISEQVEEATAKSVKEEVREHTKEEAEKQAAERRQAEEEGQKKPKPKIKIKKDVIEIRKGEILSKVANLFKRSPEFFYYLGLLIIIWIGMWIRTRNLHMVQEGVLPADPDSALFLRYMQTIIEQGSLPAWDNMRYIPLGFNTFSESRLFPYVLAYIHKIVHFFNSNISALGIDMLYPIILFPFIIIAFFFLVKKIFDWKVALVASAFLAVIPAFLQRTMLGFSDKEPLGILLMFLAFYFLVSGLKERRLGPAVIYGLLAGLFTGFLGLTWGAVSFVFMIVGIAFTFFILLGNFKKKDFAVYLAYLVSMAPVLFVSTRYSLTGMLENPTSAIIFFPLLAFVIYFILEAKLKEKFIFRLPHNITSLLVAILIALGGFVFLVEGGGITEFLSQVRMQLLHPFGVFRLTLTVAENQQPFISAWMGNFGYLFWLMILGAILLSFLIFSNFNKKYKYFLTIVSAIFILGLIFSRYKDVPIDFGLFKILFNGTNTISQFVFFGGIILFIVSLTYVYIRTFQKDKENFEKFAQIDKALVFTLIWFIWLAIGARGAIRLLFLFSPIISVLGSLLLIECAKMGIRCKDKLFKIASIILVLFIFVLLFNSSIQASAAQTRGSYPHLNPQWTNAMNWVKDNISKDAVFAHWWDYGYWIQTAGEKATVLDGGNAIPYWNHFMGRDVLTSPDDRVALEFLYTHNATHLLIDSSDIGKYPAYSTIGSDPDYDRFSWISTFNLDEGGTQETREGAIYFYRGGTVLDEDLVWQGELFAAQGVGIAGFFLPTIQQAEEIEFQQPIAVIIKANERFDIPLKSIFLNGQLKNFEGEGLDGCLYIYPKISSEGQLSSLGSAFYLSSRTKKSLMVRYYILGQESPYFELIHIEDDLVVTDIKKSGLNIPNLVDFRGMKAPIKIWKINYPQDIKANPDYLEKEFPSKEIALSRGHY